MRAPEARRRQPVVLSAKEEPNSRFTLFYGNRDASSIIFLDALAELKDRYLGRFELFHLLSDEEGDVELLNGIEANAR